MTEASAELEHDLQRLRRSFLLALCFAAILWLITLIDVLLALDLVQYGIYPGHPSGLIAVLWAPLIHGSWAHVFANTAPLLILGTALVYGYPKSAAITLGTIYLGSGLGVWLFARHAYHIGASGLTLGMLTFVFTIGALRRDKRAIALSLLVSFLYGSMLVGIFPSDPEISFETHLCGATLGIILALVLKNHDPAPLQKRYSWENEDEEDN